MRNVILGTLRAGHTVRTSRPSVPSGTHASYRIAKPGQPYYEWHRKLHLTKRMVGHRIRPAAQFQRVGYFDRTYFGHWRRVRK
jgi:hypothetical protein